MVGQVRHIEICEPNNYIRKEDLEEDFESYIWERDTTWSFSRAVGLHKIYKEPPIKYMKTMQLMKVIKSMRLKLGPHTKKWTRNENHVAPLRWIKGNTRIETKPNIWYWREFEEVECSELDKVSWKRDYWTQSLCSGVRDRERYWENKRDKDYCYPMNLKISLSLMCSKCLIPSDNL